MRAAALVLTLALFASCASLPRPWGEGVDLSTQVSGGYRALIDHPVFEGHPVAGVEFASVERARQLGYEFGGYYGQEDEGGPSEWHGEVDEVYLGLRRTFGREQQAQPYLGAGFSWSRVENFLHNPARNFDDDSGGVYLHGGVLWKVTRFQLDHGLDFLIGVDGRLLVGDEVDLGQLALVLSFGS